METDTHRAPAAAQFHAACERRRTQSEVMQAAPTADFVQMCQNQGAAAHPVFYSLLPRGRLDQPMRDRLKFTLSHPGGIANSVDWKIGIDDLGFLRCQAKKGSLRLKQVQNVLRFYLAFFDRECAKHL